MHARGEGVRFDHKNALNHENKEPPSARLSDNPKYPLKRIRPKPQGPPFLDFQLLCICVGREKMPTCLTVLTPRYKSNVKVMKKNVHIFFSHLMHSRLK